MTTKFLLFERFIRKSWFMVLRHIKENPSFYNDSCRELGISYAKETLNLGIEILETEKFELDFQDEKEREWHLDSAVKVKFVAKILHGYEAKICAIINNKILAGRIKHTAQSSKKLLKGGTAQTVFNISATNWEQNSDGAKIRFNKSLEKEVNAKKILELYQYVSSISIYFPTEINEIDNEISFLRKELEKELVNKSSPLELKQSNIGLQNHYKAWSKVNNFPKSLFNTKWLRYERRDSIDPDPNSIVSTRGFSVGCIEFIKGAKKFPVKETNLSLDTNNIETTNILNGICRFESDTNYLFVEMNKTNYEVENNLEHTSIYVLNINKFDFQNQEVIIGYHIFYSLIKLKYLVKTTLLIKYTNEHKFSFTPKILNKTDLEYNNIPIFIRKFFADRSMNRLTTPSAAISHLEKISDNSGTLKDFLSRQGKVFDDTILSSVIGSFDLFYYYKKSHPVNDDIQYLKGIRQDKLIIEYDDELCELKGVFIHKEKEIYKGKGFRKNRTIQFLLEQTNIISASGKRHYYTGDNDRKSVFFSFPVPNYDEFFFKDEIKNNLSFEGVVSGIEDESGLPLSFSALLVREEVKIDLNNPDNIMTTKLLIHFKKLSATYLATESYFGHFLD